MYGNTGPTTALNNLSERVEMISSRDAVVVI